MLHGKAGRPSWGLLAAPTFALLGCMPASATARPAALPAAGAGVGAVARQRWLGCTRAAPGEVVIESSSEEQAVADFASDSLQMTSTMPA